MRTLIVDDEMLELEELCMECESFSDIEVVGAFWNPLEALEFAQNHRIEFALLDIEMPEMDGLTLGRKLRELYPNLVMIFVTGYEAHVLDALRMRADYYLLKPYTREDIQYIFAQARLLQGRQKKRVLLRTFGHFDLFIDGRLFVFHNAKAKELLALCVDRNGGTVRMEEAIDVLWADRPYDENTKKLYRKAVIYLNNIFRACGEEQVFSSSRGKCSIHPGSVECDYFDLMNAIQNGKTDVAFPGEYMAEYSWAEETAAFLQNVFSLTSGE